MIFNTDRLYVDTGRMICIIDSERSIDLTERTVEDLSRDNCLNALYYAVNRIPDVTMEILMKRVPLTIAQLIDRLEHRSQWDSEMVYQAYRMQAREIEDSSAEEL